MGCRDVSNTWQEGLWSQQNPKANPDGFVATNGLRATYFTQHDKPWLRPIIARPFCKTMTKKYQIYTNKFNNDANRRQQSTTEKDWAWLFPENTAHLISFFKLLLRWLSVNQHFKRMTYNHSRHSLSHTKKILPCNQYILQNILEK